MLGYSWGLHMWGKLRSVSVTVLRGKYPGSQEPKNTTESHRTASCTQESYWGEHRMTTASAQSRSSQELARGQALCRVSWVWRFPGGRLVGFQVQIVSSDFLLYRHYADWESGGSEKTRQTGLRVKLTLGPETIYDK